MVAEHPSFVRGSMTIAYCVHHVLQTTVFLYLYGRLHVHFQQDNSRQEEYMIVVEENNYIVKTIFDCGPMSRITQFDCKCLCVSDKNDCVLLIFF